MWDIYLYMVIGLLLVGGFRILHKCAKILSSSEEKGGQI